MNTEDAQKEVTNIGVAYFQDWVSDFENTEQAVDSILREIKDHASGTKITGIGFWEIREKALEIVIQELGLDQLDQILEFYYGLRVKEVGDSQAFFQRLHAAIVDGINDAKAKT